MAPLSAGEWTFVVIALLTMFVLLWLTPSCGDPACLDAHSSHRVAARAASIEKEHITFHDVSRPQPTCSLCQARRRNDP